MTSDLIEKLQTSARRAAGGSAPARARLAAANPTQLNRRRSASPELRELESQWWHHFAVLEDRYFWVLPDAVQPPARTRYLARLADHLRGCKQVVDYGCGSGWIARAVAQQLQAEVIGLDFSAAQIDLARQAHAGIDGLSFETIRGPAELPRADAYIFHGLLHHLPADEIDELISNVVSRAAPGARIVVVEPTCFPGHAPDARDRALLDEIDALVAAPRAILAERGIAEIAPIAKIRQESEARWWGELPYGPSPMERPFERDELARYLGAHCTVLSSEPVQFLPASQALAGELAMLAESAPELAREIGPELQRRMDALERVLLKFPVPPDSGWYMNMLIAQVR